MTLFICTSGTSIAGGPMRPDETIDTYRARLEAKVHSERNTYRSSADFLIRASAESHALIRERVTPADEVAFLTTDTDDGKLCGDRLVRLVAQELHCQAKQIQVTGLQVGNDQLFRRVGVNSLFDTIEELTRDRESTEVRLNATGGYRGVLPYVVMYAMFRGFSVSYMYEFSEALITLPPLPLDFDWESLLPAERVLLEIATQGAIDEKTWRRLLPADYSIARERYDTLFEFEDNLVTLSVVGILAKRRLEALESAAQVFISPQASKALLTAGPEVQAHLNFALDRLRSPLHRAGFKHSESLRKTDLKVWKIYGSTGPRILYWIEAGTVYVGELFAQHDDYESYVNDRPLSRKDYSPKTFAAAESRGGQEYDRIRDQIGRLLPAPGDRAQALEAELRALRIDAQKARAERNVMRREMHERVQSAAQRATKRAHEAAEKAERKVRSSLDRSYGARLRSKDDEIAKLEALIEGLRHDLTTARNVILDDDLPGLSDATS